jgi:uncharacterized membrane protein YhaH (DUF805 family)
MSAFGKQRHASGGESIMDFNKVWQNFLDTVTKHYSDFAGRVGQQQFWFYFLVWLVVLIIAGIVGVFSGFWLLEDVIGLALVVPSGGMAARRIQDSGNNGQLAWIWVGATALRYVLGLYLSLSFFSYGFGFAGFAGYWMLSGLVNLVALAATIMVIYFGVQKGTEGPNQYGPPPAPWTPN